MSSSIPTVSGVPLREPSSMPLSASAPPKPTLRERLRKGLTSDNAPTSNVFGKALPSYDAGTLLVPEDQIAEVHKGEQIIPADKNPANPENIVTEPPKEERPTFAPKVFGPPAPNRPAPEELPAGPIKNTIAQASSVFPSVEPQSVAPDPAVIANEAKKTEAGKKGDLIGLGTALVNERHVLPTYIGPGAAKVGQGELIPEKNAAQDERTYQYQQNLTAAQKNLDQSLSSGDHERILRAKQALMDVQDSKPRFGFGKALHELSEVGQAVGGAFVPEILAPIPGTELNRKMQEGQIAKGLEQESQMSARAADKAGTFEFKADDQGNLYRLDKTGKNPPQLVSFDARGKMQTTPASGPLPPVTRTVATPTAPATSPLGQVPVAAPAAPASPTFGAKPEKQAVGDQGVKQHAAELNTLTGSMTPAEKSQFLQAYGIDANTPLEVQRQRLEDAKASAQLTAGERDRQLQRDIAERNHQDAQVNAQLSREATAAQRDWMHKETEDKDYEKKADYIDKNYVTPARTIEKSFNMFDDAFKDRKDAKTGAESMLALSTHLATTFGNVKGSRVTKDMIREHLGARNVTDSIAVIANKLVNGDVLSENQWKEFRDLISDSRLQSWMGATKEAERKGVDVNFLPDDLKAVQIPGHDWHVIHATQLDAFQKKYPNAQVIR